MKQRTLTLHGSELVNITTETVIRLAEQVNKSVVDQGEPNLMGRLTGNGSVEDVANVIELLDAIAKAASDRAAELRNEKDCAASGITGTEEPTCELP